MPTHLIIIRLYLSLCVCVPFQGLCHIYILAPGWSLCPDTMEALLTCHVEDFRLAGGCLPPTMVFPGDSEVVVPTEAKDELDANPVLPSFFLCTVCV